MKYFLSIPFLTGLLWGCAEKPKSTTIATSGSEKTSSQPLVYADSGISSFRFLKKGATDGLQYRTAETTYKVANVALTEKDTKHYLVKYKTVTDAGTQMEGQNRTIQFALSALDSPEKTVLTATHECDELVFDTQHYQTVQHGCCGSIDQVKYYDYQNKLLIEGDAKITAASIPNQFTFYFAFQAAQQDTTTIGTIQLSYNPNEAYHIKLKARRPASADCGPVVPAMTLRSASARDKYSEGLNQYDVWSLEGSMSPRQVNGLTIRVNFECDPAIGVIDIPLIKGRPFGKEDTNQVYWVTEKSRQ